MRPRCWMDAKTSAPAKLTPERFRRYGISGTMLRKTMFGRHDGTAIEQSVGYRATCGERIQMHRSTDQIRVLLLVDSRFVAMDLRRRLGPLVMTLVECYERDDLLPTLESGSFDVVIVAELAESFGPIDEVPAVVHACHPNAVIIGAAMAEQAERLEDSGFDNIYPRDWYNGNTYLPNFVLDVVTGKIDTFLPGSNWKPSRYIGNSDE